MLGRLDDPSVLVASERKPIGSGDPAAEQLLDGACNLARIGVGGRTELNRLLGRGLRDSGDLAGIAVKHGDVLRPCDPVRRCVERREVGIVGTAVGVAQLSPPELEIRAHLDQRQDAALEH